VHLAAQIARRHRLRQIHGGRQQLRAVSLASRNATARASVAAERLSITHGLAMKTVNFRQHNNALQHRNRQEKQGQHGILWQIETNLQRVHTTRDCIRERFPP